MENNPLEKWDNFVVAVFHSPAAIGGIAALGYLAHLLLSEEKATKKKIIGGLLMAVFVGTVGYFTFIALGMTKDVAAPLCILLGSSSEAGYIALMDRAKQILKIGKHSGCDL